MITNSLKTGIILAILTTGLQTFAESDPQDKGAFWQRPKQNFVAANTDHFDPSEVLFKSLMFYSKPIGRAPTQNEYCGQTLLESYNDVITDESENLQAKCKRVSVRIDVYRTESSSSLEVSSSGRLSGSIDIYCETRDLQSQNAYTMFLACQQDMKPECLQEPYLSNINKLRETEFPDVQASIKNACNNL